MAAVTAVTVELRPLQELMDLLEQQYILEVAVAVLEMVLEQTQAATEVVMAAVGAVKHLF